jgi:hypothetical protein
MTDEHLNADAAFVFLRGVYTREGTDTAVQAANDRSRPALRGSRKSMDRMRHVGSWTRSELPKGPEFIRLESERRREANLLCPFFFSSPCD